MNTVFGFKILDERLYYSKYGIWKILYVQNANNPPHELEVNITIIENEGFEILSQPKV